MLDLTPTQRGGLVRGILAAPRGRKLVVCDFAGIEARVLAWLAGDEAQLQLFREGGDPYKRIASEAIFFVPIEEVTKGQRAIGKVAELALGYGMGHRKFEATAGREKLAAAGTTAYAVVQQWRQLRAPVVELWYELERQWAAADGRFDDRDDGTRRLTLPSGRELVYREADEHALNSYWGRGGIVRVYGGLLAENLVQAASRDLLAAALVQATDAGLDVVMHCHDELVCEVDGGEAEEALARLTRIMSSAGAPAWAEGCPISCEGFICDRYRK